MTETSIAAETNPVGVTPWILMPLPDQDFDPTESAIPWKACTSRGWRVAISTEHGTVPRPDQHKLKGPLPGLLSAGAKAQAAYQQMQKDPSYQHPIPYAEIDANQYEAILLPGGDAPGMRQYLESSSLQEKVLQFFRRHKLIGAICHGALVVARTVDPETGRSVLYGYKVTALPKSLDRFAYRADLWLTRYGYIMYSCCVADEVRACLARPEDLSPGPSVFAPYVISDRNLITARWYMEAELFAERFAAALQQRMQVEEACLLTANPPAPAHHESPSATAAGAGESFRKELL
jgi:putative intracellular protease/amidase